ncbi:MAG TPA: type II secretion system protein [Tepidisphaeraceae bacterium]|jgi:prepilin-type N-terminal cleavage/methylation domain-containing protein/prepilin-type processing-associated H-X9-DG protein|nr:type II secretion system protein [Tepidisphaeraceae bacterium]
MKHRIEHAAKDRLGFTLVELLVVIGIIGVLISLLMPALTRARAQANAVKCKSNLRTLGEMLVIYENENQGYLYPVGPNSPTTGHPTTLGTDLPPHLRWPMVLFKMKGAPDPPPYDAAAYPPSVPHTQAEAVMAAYPAAPYTPACLVCPADYEPWEGHSYVLNSHLSDKTIKAGTHNFGGLTSSEVIMAGEKVTTERDYYMEAGKPSKTGNTFDNSEFDRVVEKYRHGLLLGSNYLYHDGHVDTKLPPEALTGIDPWDLKKPDTTQP